MNAQAQEAITATITGAAIQKVGFRAMIQKEAIMYNLAGSARNNADGTVSLILQGDTDRIEKTLDAIRAGSKKSSKNNKVDQSPAKFHSHLRTFTVYGWTSTTRDITTPYDLVFTLRQGDDEISLKAAKDVWNKIAEDTLKGEDLAKFKSHLGTVDE